MLETENLIAQIPTDRSRIAEVDFNNLEFGKYLSDHMFRSQFANGDWTAPMIVPFADISLSPAALGLHYGQTVFEGMKAFRTHAGRIHIFRPEKHYARFARSLERMCMQVPSRELFMEGLRALVEADAAWVPSAAGSALYIRPFVFASEARFGVKISDEFMFMIITGPVPSLYSAPISVKVETAYSRAAKGGTGFAKCGGNYGGAYLPAREARKEGYDQVLWTDGSTHATIEESGTMNVFFVIDDVLVTPPLSDSILDGVTRDSLLSIAKRLHIPATERPVEVKELQSALQEGRLTEAFGAGTAAVISPINRIGVEGVKYDLPAYTENAVWHKLKEMLDGMRYGTQPDVFGWNWYL